MKDILSKIPADRKPLASKLIDELEFMQDTLESLKAYIRKDGAVAKMENGSQNILIQHPAFKGYNTIISRYNATLKQLIELLPPSQIDDEDELIEFIKVGD